MCKFNIFTRTTIFLAAFLVAMPASADFCIQLNGGPFSGDIGFFRFQGALPHGKGKIKALVGRAAGLSPAFGTAVVAKDGNTVELGVTFFIDAVQGQFDISLQQPKFTTGGGYADYGAYGVNTGVTVAVVSCQLEPAGV